MAEVDLLELARGLSAEFKRRQMHAQLECLRRFYRAHAQAREARPAGPWTAEMVLTWAALLKVPPMEHMYPLHRRASVCPRCQDGKAILRVEVSWVDGTLVRCDGCGFKWLDAIAD